MRDPLLDTAVVAVKPSARQLTLWAFAIVFLVLLIAWAGQWAAQREADFQSDSINRAIEVHALGLRGEAAKYHYLPFTAAQHPDVIAALSNPKDLARRQRANRYLEDVNRRAGSDALYAIDLQGTTLTASNWNDPKGFVGESYANRPYFIDARQGRNGQFYGVGKTTGEPGLFLSAPVRHQGTILGVVVVKVSLRQIQETWAKARDPIMLSDAHGIFFLGSNAPWLYQAKTVVSQDDLAWVTQHEVYGARQVFPRVPWSVERTEGPPGYLIRTRINGQSRQFLAVDETLPDLGWTLTVMTDYVAVTRARNRTWMLGGLGAGLLILGGLYLQLRERRFAEQRNARRELEVRVRERTQELGEAHAFRKAMEDSLLVGMRARDLEGHIIYVNPALSEITGYRADELIGRLPPYPYWHPDDLEKHWHDNDAMMSGQAALTGFESRVRHRDGHDVHTMVYTAPLIDATGKQSGWMSSVVDISEQKRAEIRQRQHDEQLQHAQRLASLGEMASTLAHELNQPLMALSNFASAAKAFAAQGNQTLLVNSLEEIMAQAQRTAEIVRRIRSFVRQRTQGVENCVIHDVVANVLALLKPEIRVQHARVITQVQAPLPLVPGDRVLLEQVLLNLVLNSLQAMQNTPVDCRVVEIEATCVGGTVFMTVADRGPGIAADIADQLFDPFFTTKVDGLGLGLNICRTIVESHRGHLSFENREGGGVIFTLQLESMP